MSTHLLSRAECERILRGEHAEYDLVDFRLQPATDVVGFLGEYHKLSIEFSSRDANANSTTPTQHKQYFVKSVPVNNTESAKLAIFSKEAQLYGRLLPKMQEYSRVKWSPRCFLARDDLFVMEDLRAASYRPRQFPHRDTIQDCEMLQLLRGLAAMHASSLILEEKEHLNIGQTYGELLEEITVHPQVAWYTVGVAALKAVARQHEEFNESLIDERLQRVYEMVNTSSKYRNVLCHRDPWSGNVFFGSEELMTNCSSSVFVDYQTARYCPPAIDVIFAIYMNLNSRDRRDKEDQYLKWYYENFSRDLQHFGVTAEDTLSQREFRESYEKFRLFAVVYRFLAATILNVPRELVTNEYKHQERSKTVLQYMQTNLEFGSYIGECIEDIMREIRKQ